MYKYIKDSYLSKKLFWLGIFTLPSAPSIAFFFFLISSKRLLIDAKILFSNRIITALSFTVALIKFGIVNCVLKWYRQARFQSIAIFETRFALVYIAIASISVLPAHLPPR